MRPVLTLTVVGPSDLAPDDRTRSLENGRLRIGRDSDNDWVIEDPARLISRHHCTIMATDGLFTVIDTSVNGLIINDAERPLGRGNSALLSDGDILHLAGIEVAVTLGEIREPGRDPLRAVLPPRKGFPGSDSGPAEGLPPGAGPSASPGPAPGPAPGPGLRAGPVLPIPNAFPFAPRAAEPPPWLRQSAPPEPATPRPVAQVTPDDHVPAERQAFVQSSVSPHLIPDDWDADLPALRAPPPSLPLPSSPSSPPDDARGLTLVLIEALGRIALASEEEGSELFQGTPEAVLARLSAGDTGWTALTLDSLSLAIAARLGRAGAPPLAKSASRAIETDRTAEGDIAP